MIEFVQVSKLFGTKKALDTVEVMFQKGEIIGLLGPNGAGKTTTMRLIVGYLAPTRGRVTVGGRDPIEDRTENLSHIGYLPENNPLYTDMTVREYLTFISHIKQSTDQDVDSIVEKVGVEDVLSSKIETLSRGYKQRVGLASALIGDPDVLVLDEPSSGLDPIEQDKIRSLIKSFAKKKTVIISTHILSEIEEIATQLVIINKGKIVYKGDKPQKKGEVERLFKKLVMS